MIFQSNGLLELLEVIIALLIKLLGQLINLSIMLIRQFLLDLRNSLIMALFKSLGEIFLLLLVTVTHKRHEAV